jgi:hypothetical protein
MVNRAGDKGRLAENGLVDYLQANGFPYAERRRLTGSKDKGDVSGTPGLCWEAKYAGAAPKWWEWIKETQLEQTNALADYGILVIKPTGVGVTRAHLWYAAMTWPSWFSLYAFVRPTMGFLECTEPRLYRPGFQEQLWTSTFAASAVGLKGFGLRLYKPGKQDHPLTHIVVSQLDRMVHMLRCAGYGTPLEGGS